MKASNLIKLLQDNLNPNDIVCRLEETKDVVVINGSFELRDPNVEIGKTRIISKTEPH